MAKQYGYEEFNGADHQITVSQQMGEMFYLIGDPAIVQDIFTNKNKIIDKTYTSEMVFADMLGKSFLFTKGDEIWKAKRKAVSHAFYKDRVESMLDVLKN